jgi:hypothetical protein
MKTRYNLLLLGIFLLNAHFSHAQTNLSSVYQSLTKEELSSFTLETNLQILADNRKTDQSFAGVVRTADHRDFQVSMKTKGRFRRKHGEIAPLKVKFAKKELRAAGLDTLNEFKIVFPYTLNAAGEACIMREYLAYRMFERLNPYHVKARLAQVQLKDTRDGAARSITCLLLEDKEETEARLHGKFDEAFGHEEKDLDTNQFAAVALFEYMIGNTDWDVRAARNVRMFRIPGHDQLMAIPYDFDFSGLVDAPYAIPNSDLGQKNIHDRYFMASSLPTEVIRQAAQNFQNARTDLTALCNFQFLPKKASDDMKEYLEGFWKVDGRRWTVDGGTVEGGRQTVDGIR